MVEAVAEGGGDDRFGGDAGERRFEPALERGDERRGFGLGGGQTHRRALTADPGFDRIERGDAGECFLSERCGAALGDVVEVPPQVQILLFFI